jgi:nifR3 family TIM-barrel protein
MQNTNLPSFEFGGITASPCTLLSPMHGVTDSAFRRLCKQLARGRLGLLVSEFVAVEGIAVGNPNELRLMRFHEMERPFGIQIFGADPELMAQAASYAQEYGADFLEINCGCPAPKVVKRGGGSGLLRDHDNLQKILAQCRAKLSIPMTVKIRIGWSPEEVNVLETAKLVQEEGADLLVIHGRTRLQGYRGWADWDAIASAKQILSIPVVGNGDCKTAQEIHEKKNNYGVDGISVGRGAMHNPWVFGQVADLWEGKIPQIPSSQDLVDVIDLYADLLAQGGLDGDKAMGRLKQLTARVTKCFVGAEEKRGKLLRTGNRAEWTDQMGDWKNEISQGLNYTFDPGRIDNLNGKAENDVAEGLDYRK